MTSLSLTGRVAVVTGAGGGLGRAYAVQLAALGAKVVVNDRGVTFEGSGNDKSSAEKVVEEITRAGGEAVASDDSVADWQGANGIIQKAVDHFGKIDILVNNAGILRDKSLPKMDPEDHNNVISVHLDGTFYCTKAAFTHMKEQKYGRIVSTASTTGLYGNFGQVNYGSAKMGIVGLMNCLKIEGARYNILANTVVPNAGTRMTATVMPPELMEKLKPEYIAPLVAWLSSERCNVSGKIFTAGGGYFSTARIVEGPGVLCSRDENLNVEFIDRHINSMLSGENGREFESAVEHTKYLFDRIS
jgi:NAD(P)-dependent dehydrogenase (short-subunit alcohol dehydrogenase family)